VDLSCDSLVGAPADIMKKWFQSLVYISKKISKILFMFVLVKQRTDDAQSAPHYYNVLLGERHDSRVEGSPALRQSHGARPNRTPTPNPRSYVVVVRKVLDPCKGSNQALGWRIVGAHPVAFGHEKNQKVLIKKHDNPVKPQSSDGE